MSETVIVAIIGGLAVAIPSIVATFFTSRNNQKLIEYQIKELEVKVDKHNNLVERMYKVETDVKTAFKRIDDLRGNVHGGTKYGA